MLPIMHTKVLQLTTKEVGCVAIVRRAVSITLNCRVQTMQLEEKFAAGTQKEVKSQGSLVPRRLQGGAGGTVQV